MLPLVREDFAKWCASEGVATDEEKTKLWRAFWGGWDAARDRVDEAFKQAPTPSED